MKQFVPRLSRLLLILLFVPLKVGAERLPVKVYTSADGLGSSFVDYLMRDSRGFMWFCTRDGLSRFDGARFVTYRVGDKNSPPGIETISETSDGSYWIATTGGFYRFKAEALSRTDQDSGDRPFLNAEFIDEGRGATVEDRQGNIWYIGQDLYLVHEQNGKVQFERKSLNLAANPNQPLRVFQGRLGPDGSIWINTNYGLVRRLPDGRIIILQHETGVTYGLTTLTIEKNGRVWVGWSGEVYVVMPEPVESLPPFNQILAQPLKASSTITIEADRKVTLPNQPGQVVQLTKPLLGTVNLRTNTTSDGHVWITSNGELLEFDGQVFHSYGPPQGLPTGMAEIGEDAAGNLWVGGRALMRLDRKGLTSYDEDDGLNSSALFAFTEGPDGSVYAANGDFYLSRFDGKRFQSSRPAVGPSARALWTSRYALLSSANEWWILTTGGVFRFAATNLQKPLAVYDSKHGLAANEGFQIFEGSHGDIWLSQQGSRRQDFGLYRLKRGEDKFYRFSAAENFPAGKSASSLAEDRNGNFWFGFYEGGLVRFANNRFEEFGSKDGLPSRGITDLLVDRQGRLWLTSTMGGVSRVDDPGAASPKFVPLSTDQGLSSNNARTITEDHAGNIYVGTVRGVDQVSPDGTRIRHYSVNDGLAGDFVVDSYCDHNGDLWFGTTNGLSRLSPPAGEKYSAPPILLGGVRIAGEKQALSELGQAEVRQGELKYTQNNLQIDFFGLDFHAGETLRYQFMLEGADAKWSPPTEQRTVTYANLRPGSYRFLVKAINSDGTQSERPAVLSFKILPPIWLRWWFLTGAALLTIAVLYLFYRYRLARLREVNAALAEAKRAEENLSSTRAERLSELARVRTRIATDLHDDIGASLTQIAILSEVARQQNMQGNGASLAPLNSIVNVSNELVETMSDIVWAINPEKDRLQDLIQRMRRFASDLLSAKGVHFDFNAPSYVLELPLGANARREVFLIFKESLTNIAKHADATLVKIDFDISQDDLRLSITDNGRGFDLERSGPALSAREKGGHGIFSVKKRAAELNGTLDIKSAVGEGTTITVQLPLDAAARHARVATTQMGGDNGTPAA
jgi:signal transduction histidine kinase/ligand-binding sensor domain-containing protein